MSQRSSKMMETFTRPGIDRTKASITLRMDPTFDSNRSGRIARSVRRPRTELELLPETTTPVQEIILITLSNDWNETYASVSFSDGLPQIQLNNIRKQKRILYTCRYKTLLPTSDRDTDDCCIQPVPGRSKIYPWTKRKHLQRKLQREYSRKHDVHLAQNVLYNCECYRVFSIEINAIFHTARSGLCRSVLSSNACDIYVYV